MKRQFQVLTVVFVDGVGQYVKESSKASMAIQLVQLSNHWNEAKVDKGVQNSSSSSHKCHEKGEPFSGMQSYIA